MRVRWLFVLVWVAIPALALARPKIAVAPLEGDDDGKVTAAVAEEASQHASVVDPKPTQAALEKLGFSDAKSTKAQKKLRSKLGVDVIIYGEVESKGKTQRLTLSVSGRGKRASQIELSFKNASSNKFREELRDQLGKELAGAEGEAAEDDEDKPRRPYMRSAETGARHPVTESALWLDAGFAGLHRTLTYGTTGAASPPPPVGTGSFSGQLEAEVYPAAFDSLRAPAAGIGLFATAAKTVGLSIKVPGSTASAPIDEARYVIGARYRFVFGTTTVAAGASYWHQTFSADQSALPMGVTLDMPNCEYSAVAPGGLLRYAATPTIGLALALDLPLMLSSGPIATGANFGTATVLAASVEGAVDVALAPHYGLRFAALFDQISLSFKSPVRGVTSATDRTMGITATFALIY